MTTAAQAATIPATAEAGASPRPPYGWAGLAGLLVFALYAVTLAPTTAFWDTSEYIATGHILGIPHPPGNPLFVVLARAWSLLLEPFGLSVAVRINLFSAFVSAAAHALWFLVIHHVLRFFSTERTFRLVGAGVAVLVSATAFTVWNQSNVNEKVYTVTLLTIALLSWLVFRWQENLGKGKDDNLLVLMAFILALSVGNHLMAFLAAPAIGIFVLLVHPRAVLNWKLYPAVVVAGLVGLSIHLFLPIRAELDPVINEAAPECAGLGDALTSIATYGNAGCEPLSAALTRDQYRVEGAPGPGFSGPRQAPLHAQYLNYLQYFDWQWARSVQGADSLFPPLRVIFTMLFTGLGVWGAMEHHRRDRKSFWYVAVLFGTLSIALVYYLNFRWGYTIPDPAGDFDAHEVRERDYFFIAGFSVWGLWAGLGITAVWQTLSERLGSFARGAPILAVAALPLMLNWSWASRAGDYAARDWAHNLLMSVEPYGVLFTNGDNDTFPLWYLQEVEGIRKDVTVIVTSYLNTEWYAKQLRDLTTPCPEGVSAESNPTRIICQRPYVDDNTRGSYTADADAVRTAGKIPLVLDAPPSPPGSTILPFDDATIDQVAQSYVSLDRTRVFSFGDVQATLPAGSVLYPWQQYALAILNASYGDRPVHFASSGNAAGSLGLDRHLIRQGLGFKLHERTLPDSTAPGIIAMPEGSPLNQVTGDWIDLPRTQILMDSVFVHRSGLPEWDRWPDVSTQGIPNYYAWAYYALAQAANERGDTDALELYRSRGERWSSLGGN